MTAYTTDVLIQLHCFSTK